MASWGLLPAKVGEYDVQLRVDSGILQEGFDGLMTREVAEWMLRHSEEEPVLEKVSPSIQLDAGSGHLFVYGMVTVCLSINTKGALPHGMICAPLRFGLVKQMFSDELSPVPTAYLGKWGCHRLGIVLIFQRDGSVGIGWQAPPGGTVSKETAPAAPLAAAAVNSPPVLESASSPAIRSGLGEAVSIFTHKHAEELKSILSSWPNITEEHYRVAAERIPGFIHYDVSSPQVAAALQALRLDTEDEPQVEGTAGFVAAVKQAHAEALVPRANLMFPARVDPVRFTALPGYEGVTVDASHGPIKDPAMIEAVTILLDAWEVLHFAIRWPFGRHCASFVFPKKEDGTRRPTLDLRRFNDYLLPVDITLPQVADVFQQIGSSALVGILDATQAFYQTPLHMDDWGKIAVDHPTKGRMTLVRLPQGSKVATAEFVARVNAMLSPVRHCAVFVDDCSLFGNTTPEYVRTLRHILAIFQEFNIVLKLAKCKHGLKQLQILGHDLEVGVGVRPSQTSIQALLDMAPPRDVSQLMSLNGLLQWVGGRHVDHLAERTAPLTDLLAGQPRSKKGSRQPIQWSEEADRAFAELK
ncbi:MAG: reverse transcriptase family protein, partial [Dehalococcoidia bacterium]|nr:reverse transcriptase family protein [Dehalococcoidia bacterium]